MRFVTLSLFATLLSAPAFAADQGTYRPGTPYNSTVAGSADACDSQCTGDAQCRGWNYVKPNPRAAGVCEFLSSVSAPISSPISISGESQSVSAFSSRVTSGGTNTIRIGTPAAPRGNTVRVGQSQPVRKVVREAPTQRVAPQRASTQSLENLSLTEQQNRYRQARAGATNPAVQPQQATRPSPQQAYAPAQRQLFRPILDGAPRAVQGQPQQQQISRQRAPQSAAPQRQASRRVTGPRRIQQGQGQAVPQFQDPRFQAQPYQGQPQQGQAVRGQNFQNQNFQGQPVHAPRGQQPQQRQQAPQHNAQRGQSRPPVGQPIAAPRQATRPQRSTPSQRLAQLTAQTKEQANIAAPSAGPVALSPEQARKSLFGRLNDDVKTSSIPTASSVPTGPVTEQPLGEVLAGGL